MQSGTDHLINLPKRNLMEATEKEIIDAYNESELDCYEYKDHQDFEGDVLGIDFMMRKAFEAGIRWKENNSKS